MKPKKENRFRSTAMLIRLTEKEFASIKRAASDAEQPVAWWVRKVIAQALKG